MTPYFINETYISGRNMPENTISYAKRSYEMASKLRSLKRNIAKLEKMGFILPSYVKQIKKEQTAGKYSQKELMKLSKFKEIYQGKERIVSGERGRELILRERARKASETRRRRQAEKLPPVTIAFSRQGQADALDMRIRQYFNQFQNPRLGKFFSQIYEEEMAKYDKYDFLYTILDSQEEAIEILQKALYLMYPQATQEDMQESGNEWLQFLTNHSPSNWQQMTLGDIEDT